jgi:hypothetical protein
MEEDADAAATLTRGARFRRTFRSPEAAAGAGLIHAALLTAALLLLRASQPSLDAGDAEIIEFLSDRGSHRQLMIALNLVPLSMIAFLWFIAVIRHRIGEREDKLFASVFLGSGILLAALVMAGFAASTAVALMYDTTGRTVDPDTYRLLRSTGSGFLRVQAPRLGAVFVIATSTLGRRTGTLPPWLTIVGLVTGITMIVNVTLAAPIPYLFPAWVAVVSITMLVESHARAGH